MSLMRRGGLIRPAFSGYKQSQKTAGTRCMFTCKIVEDGF